MTGSYAHLRPDNPEVFIASIAAVLAQYPFCIAEEAADPRMGIARKAEFLSVKALVEWCDARLAFYQSLASYVPPAPALKKREFTAEEEQMGRDAVRGLARAKAAGTLEALTFEQAVKLGRS